MPDLINSLVTLAMLLLLQLVLGFDNLLYISLESGRAPTDQQSMVRKLGIGLAVVFRIVLLFILVNLVEKLQATWFTFPEGGWVEGSINFHSFIVLFGGVFILYTAIKEIFHMMHIDEHAHAKERKASSAAKVIALIVMMNLVFSFDSILSAMALAKNPNGEGYMMGVMIIAILVSGALMIILADKVSGFLKKNRMYEVVGLFILFVVGIMLLTEGAHLAHLKFFGNEIHAMTKTTFYFVLVVLFICEIVQSRYQKKLITEKDKKDKLVSDTPSHS